ncbi:DUF6173 family protein [Halocynthiibacter namhaensis]|uniref:DUF6173 family protein n=1 Tax=Halocynthiibacter namhaensis TaxID=1290553 RepID=UPI000578E5ED|nr:DUF6173 family protein [Halocynthiibacter namhaensis]
MAEPIETSAEASENDVLPRLYNARCNPDGSISSGEEALPAKVAKASVAKKSPAQWAYERVILYIQNFEKQLDNEHEAAMGFAGGEAGVMRIEGLGYFDPDIITYHGTDQSGAKTQLVQHVSQLNVMLRALPKEVDQAEPNRIGFRLAAELDDDVKDETSKG